MCFDRISVARLTPHIIRPLLPSLAPTAYEACINLRSKPLDGHEKPKSLYRHDFMLSARKFKESAWTLTARLHLQLPDGSQDQHIFLKAAPGSHDRTLMEGEYNAMSELYKWAPDMDISVYFFLSEFIDMEEVMPDPERLCARLAQLHRESTSPNGEFGFHITTCQGRIPQSVSWEKTWTALFTRLLLHVIKLDFTHNGPWDDLEKLETRLLSHVVPKLLRVLETEGRTLKPSLIHADLWEGNTGRCTKTGRPYIFDAAAFYAHNEMEVGNWRCHYNKIFKDGVYIDSYLKFQEPSEPKDEWDDRNRLYCIYFNIIYSVNHLGEGKAVRQTAYNDMYYLIDKFAPFPEGDGPPRLSSSEMAQLSAERDHTM
ncbi:Fructosamine kinase-domain-containing protein [Xylariaceae sp. FL0594]|nr:Fructosamine kinase-domain-containing protein [Xylariaceae sp. FL0594]